MQSNHLETWVDRGNSTAGSFHGYSVVPRYLESCELIFNSRYLHTYLYMALEGLHVTHSPFLENMFLVASLQLQQNPVEDLAHG
jgi:hypothetical protein